MSDAIQLPKGGRGKKASYQTHTIRVPVPCLDAINKVVAGFHLNGNLEGQKILSKHEAEAIAQKILSQKKSAKVSIEKLLTAIYGE